MLHLNYTTFPSSREMDRTRWSLRAYVRSQAQDLWAFRSPEPAGGQRWRLAACPVCLGPLAGRRCPECRKVF